MTQSSGIGQTWRSAFAVGLLAWCLISCGGGSQLEGTAQADALLDSAMTFIDLGDDQRAMMALKQAEGMIDELSDAKQPYQITYYIGWVNERNRAYALAQQYYGKALAYAQKMQRPQLQLDVLLRRTQTFFDMNQPDSAWMTNQQAAALSDHADDSQHALLLRHRAYYELQLDSFDDAAQHAYQSAIVAQDSTSMGEALALLCAAYIRQGNDTQAELVMRTMPGQGGAMQRNRLLLQGEYMEGKGDYEGAMKAYKRLVAINDSLARMQRNVEMVSLQERYDREVISREKAEQRIWYSLAIIALLFVVFGAWLILSRRHRRIYRRYHEGLRNMNRQLGARELTISELKADIDRRLAEMQTLKQQLSQFSSQTARREVEEIFTSVSDTKAGIDVLYTIVSGQNISQYGKREETALRQILQPVNPQLAAHIDSATQPLTPKEVFYCVMQHYGMTDEEKIQAFCCTPQALRSIKSRLGKKM